MGTMLNNRVLIQQFQHAGQRRKHVGNK